MRSLTPSVARQRLAELLSASRTRAAMLMHAFVDNRAREAEDLYAELAAAPPSGALHGLFAGVKDILRIDGQDCLAGSALPASALRGPEASAVTLLKQAGATILARTVTAEFAHRRPGPTRNPWDAGHTPGGSSSGSAAAVAAGLVDFSIGTQTNGSIIRPAAFCGVAGFKPSHGRVRNDGLVFFSPSIDQLGFFAREVADLELVASVLVDGWCERTYKSCREGDCAKVPSPPVVLGVADGPLMELACDEARSAFEHSVQALGESPSFTVRRVSVLDDLAAIARRHVELAGAEMAAVHSDWFEAHACLYSEVMAEAVVGGKALAPRLDVLQAEGAASMLGLRTRLHAEMHSIDYWLTPGSVEGAAPQWSLGTTGDPAMARPWTHAGLPALAIPSGRFSGGVSGGALPHALQIVGQWGDDERLLACGTQVAAELAPARVAELQTWPPASYCLK